MIMGQMRLGMDERIMIDVPVNVDMGGMRIFGSMNGTILCTINGVVFRDVSSDPIIRSLAWEVQNLRSKVLDSHPVDLTSDDVIQMALTGFSREVAA